MKKSFLVALFCVVSLFSAAYAGDDSEYEWPAPSGMLRGIANMATCPGELGRGWYYWSKAAFHDHSWAGGIDGFIWGTLSGTFWTAGRFTVGFLDLALGIPGNYIHGDFFPTFVWDDRWEPETNDD